MKTYELTYIISPEITSEEAEAVSKEIESFVQGKEGIILNKTTPVAKSLAYPIKKHASGFIGALEFQVEAEKLSEIEEKIDKEGKIIRHMTIVKRPMKVYKARRMKKSAMPAVEKKETEAVVATEKEEEPTTTEEKKPASAKAVVKEKVELKDIEQQLDEILGQ